MKPKNPPDENEWEALGLYDRCTCLEYEWEDDICSYSHQIFDDESLCKCCPYHHQECYWNI